MFLKCETTLNVYQHNANTILCRVNVVSPGGDKSSSDKTNETTKNTCRCLTAEQWHDFDEGLQSWLNTKTDWSNIDLVEDLYKFTVEPNIEVRVKRSKISTKYFIKCIGKLSASDDNDDDVVADKDTCLPVLDCLLEYKHDDKYNKVPPTPTIPTEEYDPLEYDPYAPSKNEESISPVSYTPYTPTKKTRKFSAADKIKTPGLDFLAFDSSEDTYSPNIERHLAASKVAIPVYKPAPITDKSPAEDIKEVILESDDDGDFVPTKTHRSIRVREKYVPHTQEKPVNVPAYKPTPIGKSNDCVKQETLDKSDDTNESKAQSKKDTKKEKGKSSKDEKVKTHKGEDESKKSKEDFGTSKKISQEKESAEGLSSSEDELSKDNNIKSKSKATEDTKATKSNSTSEDDFEEIIKKHKAMNDNKDNSQKDKKNSDSKQVPHSRTMRKRSESRDSSTKGIKTDSKPTTLSSVEEENEESASNQKEKKKDSRTAKKHIDNEENDTSKDRKGKQSSKETETIPSREKLNSEDEFENNSTKRKQKKKDKNTSLEEEPTGEVADKKLKKKDKRKEKSSSNDKLNKSNEEKENSDETKRHKSKDKTLPSKSPLRRSERSPSKPKRFIEEHEEMLSSPKKKQKSSPKNKELFGTDDDDENELCSSNDNNNNASSKISSAYETPKPNKKIKSILLQSSSSSSSAKKKRKRDDCEQEKVGMSKWLGKKPQNKNSEDDESPKTSLKSSKKIKSASKEDKRKRPKSPSPKPMEIVMPSEQEMEMIRNKAKQQSADNEKLKAVLEKVNVAPKKVEQLSLKDMTLKDLMETFSSYKSDMDEIYEKYRKKDYVKSHDGVNHCLVIGLIDHKIQLKMMEKLSEKYNSNNSTSQATLYANALLPEWILRVFMNRYNLNRSDAIQHIVDQEAYKSYTDAENECSFLDDL
ncbi:uncharacterized protein [Musca autumnalis]|uniref:uncharacterized protein n=1 Tax=Musca autumnalis TaxID=221902 RepID=UPI003CEDB2E2